MSLYQKLQAFFKNREKVDKREANNLLDSQSSYTKLGFIHCEFGVLICSFSLFRDKLYMDEILLCESWLGYLIVNSRSCFKLVGRNICYYSFLCQDTVVLGKNGRHSFRRAQDRVSPQTRIIRTNWKQNAEES